ncbi:MAG: hypothetical protein H6728_13235 [Myxococcales bacterium]|nr:hypothetical protein [Myxococcales bacterium]MCB9644033.1 hypothetical protein [Myxococcales bacterium]
MASPEFKLYTTDAHATETSLQKPRSWEIDKIFLCHGALIEEDAKEIFEQVCQELLRKVRGRWSMTKSLVGWASKKQ